MLEARETARENVLGMVTFCAIVGCGNRADRNKDKTFYPLPVVVTNQGAKTKVMSESRRRGWIAAIRREDNKPENYANTQVCSDHFVSGKPADLCDSTNPDWIPSQNLGHNHPRPIDSSRTAERNAKRKNVQEASSRGAKGSKGCSQVTVGTNTEEGAVGSELYLNELKKERERLYIKAMKLARAQRKLAARMWSEEWFEDDDRKVCLYTGLPSWDFFLVFFKSLEPCLSTGGCESLTACQQVIVTLLQLRLNLHRQDLAIRFGVHKSTISRTFVQVIEALYVRLKPFIMWPDRDVLKKTMPVAFQEHCPNCAVIIDCYTICVKRPSNILAMAQTYSSYERQNAAKYLIGLTPHGTVSFISKGCGGRVSDRHLTENSGLLNHLLPGDVVLADRTFDIPEAIGTYCPQVRLRAFTKGEELLDVTAVDQTRRIANVRLDVERMIGDLRQKYTILSGTQPVAFLIPRENDIPLLDKIVSVCCALANICDSVVPLD